MNGDRPIDLPKSDDSSNSADSILTLDGAYFDVTRATYNLFAFPDLRATKKRKEGDKDAEKDFFA